MSTPPRVIDLHDQTVSVTERRLADEVGRVTEGDPQHKIRMHHQGLDGRLRAGHWVSTPGKWHAFTGRAEYCYIIRGRCALVGEDGTRQEFSAGSSFLIPEGFRGYWEVLEETEKHFVIVTTDDV